MTAIALRLVVMVAAALALFGCWQGCSRLPLAAGPAWQRRNYRNRPVSAFGGPVLVAVAAAGCGAVASMSSGAGRRVAIALLLAVAAAGLAGLYDDLRGDASAKGLRGHGRALASGRVTSGIVKVAMLAISGVAAAAAVRGGFAALVAVDGLLVAACANLVNLLDLRPGRAAKVAGSGLVAIALVTARGGVPLAWCAGAIAGWLPVDLREHAMLGDAGANAIGAAVGVGIVVAALPAARVGALVIVIGMTLLSERVSFSRVIEATPPLRWLDQLGRADTQQAAGA